MQGNFEVFQLLSKLPLWIQHTAGAKSETLPLNFPAASKALVREQLLHNRRSSRHLSALQQPAQCSGSATADPIAKPVNVSFSTHYQVDDLNVCSLLFQSRFSAAGAFQSGGMHLQAAFGDRLKLVGNHEATGSWILMMHLTWNGMVGALVLA